MTRRQRERDAVLAGTMTHLRDHARRQALDAGLDDDAADAVAHRVAERFLGDGPRVGYKNLLAAAIADEIQKHANP